MKIFKKNPVLTGVIALMALCAAWSQGAPPSWWQLPTNKPAADNAVASVGQTMYMAHKAKLAMEAVHGNARVGSRVGLDPKILQNLADHQTRFLSQGDIANQKAITIGQLKSISAPYWRQLEALGTWPPLGPNGQPTVQNYNSSSPYPYPWTLTKTDDKDNAFATLGQVKAAFAFNINQDANNNGIQDGWEYKYTIFNSSADSGDDSDGDGLTNLQEYQRGTNPMSSDPDGDGLSDRDEVITDPFKFDTDSDGMGDGWEIAHGLNPLVHDANVDADGDGWTNLQEYAAGTDPWNKDTDGDGQNDNLDPNPLLAPLNDTDNDGLNDDWERHHAYAAKPDGTQPAVPNALLVFSASGDWDGDGLTDLQEYSIGTNPTVRDTDGDSVSDKVEWEAALDPLDADDLGRDSDGDGLSDGVERLLSLAAYEKAEDTPDDVPAWVSSFMALNALSAHDSDRDGMSDDWERVWAFDPQTTAAAGQDTDGDGLSDLLESRYRTWPRAPMTELLSTTSPFCDFNGDGVTDILAPVFKFAASGFFDRDSPVKWVQVSWVQGTGGSISFPTVKASFTAPNSTDTDNDGLNDGAEVSVGRNPFMADSQSLSLNPRAAYATVETSPGVFNTTGVVRVTSIDSDGDSLPDAVENAINSTLSTLFGPYAYLNPNDPTDLGRDTDNDGISDGVEALLAYTAKQMQNQGKAEEFPVGWLAGCLAMNPRTASDLDGDGLSDAWELIWHILIAKSNFRNTRRIRPMAGRLSGNDLWQTVYRPGRPSHR